MIKNIVNSVDRVSYYGIMYSLKQTTPRNEMKASPKYNKTETFFKADGGIDKMWVINDVLPASDYVSQSENNYRCENVSQEGQIRFFTETDISNSLA